MRVFDTSNYCTGEDISNFILEVLPPSKSSFVTFNIVGGFSLVLNSSNLRYKKANNNSQLIDLQDGVYDLSLSYKPNSFTLTKFYHLRTVALTISVRKEWKKLISDQCRLTREEYYMNRDKLREIEEYALAAKYTVEECGEKKQGKEIYEFAKKLLDQYSHECKC